MSLFDLVFTGELIDGCDPARVRRDLERLFRTDAAEISRLFTGKPVYIKKAVDEQTAMRYRAALQQAGALCRIQPTVADGTHSAPVHPAGSGDLAAAAILPPGSILPQSPRPEPPQFDFTGFSVAPPGVILVDQPPQTVAPPAAGAFEVAPAGADLAERSRATPAPVPDISSLTMAPPGTEVLSPEERERPDPPPPDPGDLTLADR